MQPADLEETVHRELRQLPLPRAPETLLPRVLAAVEAWSHRPWYSRAWFTWPLGWQIASAAAAALVIYGLWALPPAPPEVAAATSATRVVWRTLVQPLLTYVFVLVALMCVACAVFGAALNYLFMERTASR